MEIDTIDRYMAYVILRALSIASCEGVSSLVVNNETLRKYINNEDYAEAEFKVLKQINEVYPALVSRFFNINNQIMVNR